MQLIRLIWSGVAHSVLNKRFEIGHALRASSTGVKKRLTKEMGQDLPDAGDPEREALIA